MDIGDRYRYNEFGISKVFKVISEEDAIKNRGEEFVKWAKRENDVILVLDENKNLTKAFSIELLKQYGTKIEGTK